MSKISTQDIDNVEQLREVFIRLVANKPEGPDDRVELAQGLLCTITRFGDSFLNTSADNQEIALKTVETVLQACATVVEQSGVDALARMEPEIREHAAAYIPVAALV